MLLRGSWRALAARAAVPDAAAPITIAAAKTRIRSTALPPDRKRAASPASRRSTAKPSKPFVEAPDLNARLSSATRAEPVSIAGVQSATVLFEGIAAHLCALIGRTPFVVGCMAWLSDPDILASLSRTQGVSVVVTNDALLSLSSVTAAYQLLPPLPLPGVPVSTSAVRCLGSRSGRFRALMHHKFLVGLDAARQPQWVVTGSFNASGQAARNIENALVVRDVRLADAYFREFRRVLEASKAIAARRV